MKEIYTGNYVLRVTEEVINGDVYEKAYTREAVITFPVNDQGKILIIKERRRHEPTPFRWKPVTGFLEDNESWQENAAKELQEEAGYRASKFELIGEAHHTGTLNTSRYFVLAKGLTLDPIPNPDGDVIMEIKAFTLEELIDMNLSGEIPMFFDNLGFFLLKEKLERGLLCLD
jgi:ADP-ribose pyrophosphatase